MLKVGWFHQGETAPCTIHNLNNGNTKTIFFIGSGSFECKCVQVLHEVELNVHLVAKKPRKLVDAYIAGRRGGGGGHSQNLA